MIHFVVQSRARGQSRGHTSADTPLFLFNACSIIVNPCRTLMMWKPDPYTPYLGSGNRPLSNYCGGWGKSPCSAAMVGGLWFPPMIRYIGGYRVFTCHVCLMGNYGGSPWGCTNIGVQVTFLCCMLGCSHVLLHAAGLLLTTQQWSCPCWTLLWCLGLSASAPAPTPCRLGLQCGWSIRSRLPEGCCWQSFDMC